MSGLATAVYSQILPFRSGRWGFRPLICGPACLETLVASIVSGRILRAGEVLSGRFGSFYDADVGAQRGACFENDVGIALMRKEDEENGNSF